MKTLNATQENQIFDFLNSLDTEICITDYANVKDFDCEDFENDFFDYLVETIQENNGFDCEVIYYSNAIAYLQENDPSLRESLEIAQEFGYEAKDLNSEILATLLKSQNVRNDFQDLETEINDFFSELYESLEDEDEE